MTTQLNGTEFVTLTDTAARRATPSPVRTTIALRRDQRRVRRANRAI
ncbi:hypothetical protein [Litorimonas sp. WD9-15]